MCFHNIVEEFIALLFSSPEMGEYIHRHVRIIKRCDEDTRSSEFQPKLPLTGSMTVGKPIYFSGPQFPQSSKEEIQLVKYVSRPLR